LRYINPTMAIRAILVTMLLLCARSSVHAVDPTLAPVPAPVQAISPALNCTGDMILMGLLNEGYPTDSKHCTEEDFNKVMAAVNAAFVGSLRRSRTLRGARPQRKLSGHCPNVCAALTKYTCLTISGCSTWAQVNCNNSGCDRKLEEEKAEEEEFTFLNLDEVWSDDARDPNNRRLEQTCGITEPECIEGKAKLIMTALSVLGDVDTTCANFVLSPMKLTCMVAVHPAT
jgi:hypothetical protein